MRHNYLFKEECPQCGSLKVAAYTYCFYDKIDLVCDCGYRASLLNTDENYKRMVAQGFDIGFLGKEDYSKEFKEFFDKEKQKDKVENE